eukprot:CAMPEP_0114491602 /NCGR_PEP_ID=MMETSP0109-20121206/3096_1 /TAXON_ID=29199 /ORGANISM="Chlorarachnion reptans, Strain CCCM449" /LENGTH=1895 /DNA_ID=CAMNT_0001668363 /DNA_START=187 /DNA_END=5870 /DNA_ORIENTATION=+
MPRVKSRPIRNRELIRQQAEEREKRQEEQKLLASLQEYRELPGSSRRERAKTLLGQLNLQYDEIERRITEEGPDTEGGDEKIPWKSRSRSGSLVRSTAGVRKRKLRRLSEREKIRKSKIVSRRSTRRNSDPATFNFAEHNAWAQNFISIGKRSSKGGKVGTKGAVSSTPQRKSYGTSNSEITSSKIPMLPQLRSLREDEKSFEIAQIPVQTKELGDRESEGTLLFISRLLPDDSENAYRATCFSESKHQSTTQTAKNDPQSSVDVSLSILPFFYSDGEDLSNVGNALCHLINSGCVVCFLDACPGPREIFRVCLSERALSDPWIHGEKDQKRNLNATEVPEPVERPFHRHMRDLLSHLATPKHIREAHAQAEFEQDQSVLQRSSVQPTNDCDANSDGLIARVFAILARHRQEFWGGTAPERKDLAHSSTEKEFGQRKGAQQNGKRGGRKSTRRRSLSLKAQETADLERRLRELSENKKIKKKKPRIRSTDATPLRTRIGCPSTPNSARSKDQHPDVLPTLRGYQLQATKWMILREKSVQQNSDHLERHYLWEPLCAQEWIGSRPLFPKSSKAEVGDSSHSLNLYWNRCTGHVARKAPDKPLDTPGGILAEEMGLGKTIETLHLICSRRRTQAECYIPPSLPSAPEKVVITEDCKTKQKRPSDYFNRKMKGKKQKLDLKALEAKERRDRAERVKKQREERQTRRERRESNEKSSNEDYNRDSGSDEDEIEDQQERSEAVDEAVDEDSDVKLEREDPACCVCEGLYSHSKKGDRWVCCDHCESWHHAKCVLFGEEGLVDEETGSPDPSSLSKEKMDGYDKRASSVWDDIPFCCPFCWRSRCEKTPVRAKTTLIVSPAAIVGQWATEIKKHTRAGAISMCRYYGLKGQRAVYLSPSRLAKHDVVLTTYGVLRAELYRAQGAAFERGGLRRKRRRRAAPSPLMDLEWWRVVIDEAQMAESSTAHAAQMCRKLRTVHRWAVTGTPVNRSVNDIWGLLLFLKSSPYSHKRYWLRDILEPLGAHINQYKDPNKGFLVKEEHRRAALGRLGEAIGPLFWRKTKDEVRDELCLPTQHEEVVRVEFSEVEAYNYERLAKDCEDKARRMLRRFGHYLPPRKGGKLGCSDPKKKREAGESNQPRDNSKRLEKDAAAAVLASLLALRQACCHPMLGRAANRAFARSSESLLSLQRRKQSTIGTFLAQLIQKEELECTKSVRERVVCLNGLAGLAAIQNDPYTAAERYAQVLELAGTKALWTTSEEPDSKSALWKSKRNRKNGEESMKGKSMVDKTLIIHAVHHLRELLEANSEIRLPRAFSSGHAMGALFSNPTDNTIEGSSKTPSASPSPQNPGISSTTTLERDGKDQVGTITVALKDTGVSSIRPAQVKNYGSISRNSDKKGNASPHVNLAVLTAARRHRTKVLDTDQAKEEQQPEGKGETEVEKDPATPKRRQPRRVRRRDVIELLRKREEQIRNEYINSARLMVAQATNDAQEMIAKTTHSWKRGGWNDQYPWWGRALAMLDNDEARTEAFTGRIVDALTARTAGVAARILDQVRTLNGLQYVIQTTIETIQTSRMKAIAELKKLHAPNGPSRESILAAGNCKICCGHMGRNGPACPHCKCKRIIRQYELRLFQTRKISHGEGAGAVNASAAAAFIYGDGQTVDAQQESPVLLILRLLYGSSEGKKAVAQFSTSKKKGGTSPLEWIESLRKEFFSLGEWWSAQQDELLKLDELEMGLLRIRLKNDGEDVQEEQKHYVVSRWKVAEMQRDFEQKDVVARASCAKKMGQLFYLRTLVKRKEHESKLQQSYECPVCLTAINAKKSGMIVWTCGHVVCYSCGMTLLQHAQSKSKSNPSSSQQVGGKGTKFKVNCPKCRIPTAENDLGYVERKTSDSPTQSDEEDTTEL